MSHKIIINGFGPISEAEIDLNKNFQILIGEQASGKSTICKVVHFCQKIRDYTLEFLMDSSQFSQNHKNEYFNNYLKYLTKQFMGCFGTTKHMNDFNIQYSWGNRWIKIFLNSDGYVRFSLQYKLKEDINSLINEASEMFLGKLNSTDTSILDNITAVGIMQRHLYEKLSLVFDSDAEIIYVPAGRSLLATMSEQLQDVSVSELDLTMQEFVKLIRATKNKFGYKIPEMVQNYTKTVKGQINNSAVKQAYNLIRKILKADYTSENDGEKMYFNESQWVKLIYSSSGQQEALWILMLAFSLILERRKTYIVIEEPEAHLFPMAQKDIVALIALMVNACGGKVIITTHSPYILTSANILLYSDKIENHAKESQSVVPRSIRLSYKLFDAFKVGSPKPDEEYMESLMDEESHMINVDYIDEVSLITNNELNQLLDMETDE